MRQLLLGGTIYTTGQPGASAMLLVDGIVAWIGTDAGARNHLDEADRVVELGGALVTPAFVDAHAHHTATGLALVGPDLSGADSAAEVLDRVARHATAQGSAMVVGHGWDDAAWPDRRLPAPEELDRASGGLPVYLSRADLHSGLISTAMEVELPELAGAAGFHHDGRVTGEAHHLVRRHVARSLPATLRTAAQRAARTRAAAAGVACLHEAGGPDVSGADDLRGLIELAASEPGPHLVAYWGSRDLAEVEALGAAGAAGDLFVDGSLGSRTAWLREPYADAPASAGTSYLDPQQVADHLIAATDAGVQAGFHAIGDAALDAVATGLATAMAHCGGAAVRALRHRVEHAVLASPEHIAVLAEAGAVASMQPAFDALWGGAGGVYEQRLGAARAGAAQDLAGLVRSGVSVALGSDSPVTPIAPWEWVRAAMWHHEPRSRLSGRAAFAAATRGGWRAARIDDVGVLAVGWPATLTVWRAADLVVAAPDPRVANWSTDPRSGTPALPRLDPGLPVPDCLATVVSGRPIHVADDWQW